MIGKQTTLDLNGPILSFIQQPQSVSVCDSGSATFVGIATAFFPEQDPPNPASNTGTLSYRWNAEGFGPLTDGTFQGATITGSGTTTLTIANATSPVANGLRLFVGVDYVPSAYSQPVGSAVTVGTGRSTGNAVNEVLNSDTATLTVFPKILIITQPQDTTVDDENTATFSVNAELTDTSQGTLSYQWLFNDQELSNSSTVSGATSPNLSIRYTFRGVYSIQVRITHPVSCDSPLLSNEVVFGVVPPSQIITVETMTSSSSTATIQSQDLVINNELTLLAQNYTDPTSLISLFAPGRNIDVEMDIYSGKGNDSGSYSGGTGGYSKIRFTMNRNEEYIIAGLNSINNNPFVYRKSSLIAVCGKGGDAASGGRGGNGGGIGISGQNGSGPSSGTGGQLISSGTLSSIGIFGSSSTASPRSPDTKATTPTGGRTIPCPKGDYWISRGFSPCQDVGTSKFFYGSTEITNTSAITRGFKQGYDIRQTAGSGVAPTTGTRFVSRTCTRTIPRTCYRTVSRSVTKRTTFNHVFDNVNFRTTSFTSSGDPMTATINGEGTPASQGARSYSINVSGLGLNSTNYSVSVSNTNQAASGGFPGLTAIILNISGFTVSLAFRNNQDQVLSFARNFTVTINGTANFQESFDCSTTESYDCSYNETFTISGGGNGGSGATGGNGGGSGGAGGGGSGYTDGSVQVLESTSGGNNGNARIVLRTLDI
jgi:hypothetical protein